MSGLLPGMAQCGTTCNGDASKEIVDVELRGLAHDGLRLRITSPCEGSVPRVAELQRNGVGDDVAGGEPNGEASGPGLAWDGFCAVCKRPLSVALVEPPKRNRCTEPPGAGRCAFVIALWGSSPEYVLGAMVLAWSLRRTGTRHDLVLVHTSDVSAAALALLQRAGWRPREIEHVSAASRLSNDGCSTMRFANVFTKLRVLDLVEYAKILMMDIDLLVRENIDDLFDLPAPAAMVRGPSVGYEHGARVDGRRFFVGRRTDRYSWGQASGINAGVMLLRPDAEVFQQMLAEVEDASHPGHIRGNGPEQDYLSRFYAGDWRHLSVAYNFQLHHVYFALSPAIEPGSADRTRFLAEPDLIKIFHYSSEPKPWSRLLEEKYMGLTDRAWLDEVLMSFSGYRAWVLNEPEHIEREVGQNGLVMGPDGRLHKIDWQRVSSGQGGVDTAIPESTSPCAIVKEDAGSAGAVEHTPGEVEWAVVTNGVADAGGRAAGEGGGDADGDRGLVSADGWPLGDAVEVPQAAIDGAEQVIQLSQDLWFAAFRELAADLGESDLAGVVKAACTGPVVRQEWDWSSGSAQPAMPGVEDAAYAATWTRDGTGGWWVEGPTGGRCVASAGRLPQAYASLSVGGSMLLAASSPGVHAAAFSAAGAACPEPQSFAAGAGGSAAAAAWAGAVPDGAMVLVAAIDGEGDCLGTVLEAMAGAGLGHPAALPSVGCAVAAAVGQKGERAWYATHAAADIALATAPVAAPSHG